MVLTPLEIIMIYTLILLIDETYFFAINTLAELALLHFKLNISANTFDTIITYFICVEAIYCFRQKLKSLASNISTIISVLAFRKYSIFTAHLISKYDYNIALFIVVCWIAVFTVMCFTFLKLHVLPYFGLEHYPLLFSDVDTLHNLMVFGILYFT
jgi:hypothetical protein